MLLQMGLCYRLVESPVKVLAEIKADGGSIEMVDGEIVAGDAGNLNVVSMRSESWILIFILSIISMFKDIITFSY